MFQEQLFLINRDRQLDVAQVLVDGWVSVVGPNQQVDMLGHQDERDQRDTMLLARGVDRAGQLFPDRVVRQQGDAPIAGKGQFMQIARLVVVLDRLVFLSAHRVHSCAGIGWAHCGAFNDLKQERPGVCGERRLIAGWRYLRTACRYPDLETLRSTKMAEDTTTSLKPLNLVPRF